jgi:hypothetical protein
VRLSVQSLVIGLAAAMAAMLAVTGCGGPSTPSAPWPVTSLHFASNGNFSAAGGYLPAAAGFNIADVDSHVKSELDSLPDGVRALVWLGDCGGVTPAFRSAVAPFAGDPKLFGFYVMDEPTPSTCPARNLRAENDWIHAHVPGAKTFAILTNLGRAAKPDFAGSYTPQDSGLDLIGLDPYPVRSELQQPDYAEITAYVRSAESIGWPESSIVPVYQAFGGGNYPDDANGHWVLPTAAQERQLLAAWATVVPHPRFDYAYSWGSQKGDSALGQSKDLRVVFAEKDRQAKSRSQAP